MIISKEVGGSNIVCSSARGLDDLTKCGHQQGVWMFDLVYDGTSPYQLRTKRPRAPTWWPGMAPAMLHRTVVHCRVLAGVLQCTVGKCRDAVQC